MSVNSTLGVNFTGLSSGIDTESIVQRLLRFEAIPIQRLQRRQAQLQGQMGVYGEFRSKLRAITSAASAFNVPNAFNPMRAASSQTDVASVSATSTAAAGSYALRVYQLAQAQKLSSSPQASATNALGAAGTFTIEGQEVTVAANDSLLAIAAKINASGSGVAATVLDGGAGQAYLSLTGSKTGAANKLALADTSGTVLRGLGFLATQVREPITQGARSTTFDSQTATLASLADFDGVGLTNVLLNGQQVAIDPNTDTLQTLATKLNGVSGVTATVVSVTEFGRTTYRLDVTGTSSTPAFGEEGGIFLNLGVLKRSSELFAAQDARFSIDGLALRGASNDVSSVIPGVSVSLLRADATTPETSTITVSRDMDGVKSLARGFVAAVNGALEFVRQNSQFNKETFATGPLFGDSVAIQMQDNLGQALLRTVSGLVSGYDNLTLAGFTIDTAGNLKFDEAAFETAFNANPTAMANLFRATGRGTTPDITFVSSSSRTRHAGSAGYDVVITQAARKAEFSSAATFDAGILQQETLTFQGAHIGNDYQVVLQPGTTLQQTIDRINGDDRLRTLVQASNVGGRLVVTSLRYGAVGDFTMFSDLDAGSGGTTGVGLVGEGSTMAGLDVAGTINGEEAVGSGQFLTGKAGNANTDGLQIQVTGSATGAIGKVHFTKGVATQTFDLVDGFLATTTGLLSATENGLQSHYDDLATSISAMQERMTRRGDDLRRKFTAMEQSIAALQSQSLRLTAMLGNAQSAR